MTMTIIPLPITMVVIPRIMLITKHLTMMMGIIITTTTITITTTIATRAGTRISHGLTVNGTPERPKPVHAVMVIGEIVKILPKTNASGMAIRAIWVRPVHSVTKNVS